MDLTPSRPPILPSPSPRLLQYNIKQQTAALAKLNGIKGRSALSKGTISLSNLFVLLNIPLLLVITPTPSLPPSLHLFFLSIRSFCRSPPGARRCQT